MSGHCRIVLFGLPFVMAAGFGCATPPVQPTLTLEQHTLRIPLQVGSDGTVSFADQPPLIGRIDLSPIMAAEGIGTGAPPTTVQIVVHYGRLYVAAADFDAIWEITPRPGSTTASYRSIPIAHGAEGRGMPDIRLSRYGSPGASCLRIDRASAAPVFITAAGEARGDCP
ncbi:MAG TPA: hypothetical protein VFG08_08400 [Candidatus Polarisedimenticolia bacterium]|nr:hypothetical protein [Candidatus Polarisedimenticolia bacterium]